MKKTADSKVLTATRRTFLKWQAALLVAVLRPGSWAQAESQEQSLSLLNHFFSRELPEAIQIGRQYLESAPSERSASQLGKMILGNAWGDRSIDTQDLTTRVRARREQDFREGELVEINGWFFARTEARLCALAALTAHG